MSEMAVIRLGCMPYSKVIVYSRGNSFGWREDSWYETRSVWMEGGIKG